MPKKESQLEPLGSRGFFELCDSGLRMLGTANATGAIAAGAAFQAFAQNVELQRTVKLVAVVFLFGILAFAVAYMSLSTAKIQLENFITGSRERLEWHELFWIIKKEPNLYLRSSARHGRAAILLGGISTCCFFVGLGLVILMAIKL